MGRQGEGRGERASKGEGATPSYTLREHLLLTSGSCTSFMKRMARFSRTMPSLAAKKARTCEMKWRSPSDSFSQCFMSSPRSTSSAAGRIVRGNSRG